MNNLKYLNYSNVDELSNNYVINKRESKKFLLVVNLSIKFANINLILLSFFAILIHLRVLFAALPIMPLYLIILSYIPNAISFYICIISGYQHSICAVLIYFFGCFFTFKSIKSLTKNNLFFTNDREEINNLARLSLKAFKDLLDIFNSNQKFIDLHLTPFYVSMFVTW